MTDPRSRRGRVRAPALQGRRWLNTGGADLTLDRLRGRVVLLDFWTGCCVNCTHVAAELHGLDDRFGEELVVIGVRSPKFPHEAEPEALAAAVQRLDLRHPVLDDADLRTWQSYAVKAWPTLVLVDPTGYVAATFSGEGHVAEIADRITDLLVEHAAAGTLSPAPSPYVPEESHPSPYRFPARILRTSPQTLLLADTGHGRLVELADDLGTELRSLTPEGAGSFLPRGLCRVPTEVAAVVGYDVVVADPGGHALWGLRLADGSFRHLAGTGEPLRRREGGGPAVGQALSSPEDVCWFDDQVVVAMSGVHQLWGFDPLTATIRVIAGTSAEGLADGPAETAWFAQPSALAVDPTGSSLWFLDAETSSLRRMWRTGPHDRGIPMVRDVRFANVEPIAFPGYRVETVVGEGLFEFGLVDGATDDARLQHPRGLAVAPDSSVLVADTYNGALRRYRPATGELETLLAGLAEPVDVLLEAETVVVVESAGHRVSRLPLLENGCGDLCRPLGIGRSGS